MNWKNRKTETFKLRLTSACMNDNGFAGQGGDPGGGGGGGAGSGEPAAPSTDSSNFGGASPQTVDYGSWAGSDEGWSTPEDAVEVGNILETTNDQTPLSLSQLGALLRFNPPMTTPKAPASTANPAAPAVQPPAQATTPSTAQPAPGATPTQPQPQTPQAPGQDVIQAAVAAALKAHGINVPTPDAPQGGGAPSTQPQAPKPYYGGFKPPVEINPALAADIFQADDPVRANNALGTLVNGIMNQVMTDTMQMTVGLVQKAMQSVPNMVQARETTRDVTNTFYTRHKELDKPGWYSVVNQVMPSVVQARKAQGKNSFDDEFYSELANAAHIAIEQNYGFSIRPQPTPVAPATPAARAPQAPAPWVTPQGSRPPAGPAAPSQSAAYSQPDPKDLRSFVI